MFKRRPKHAAVTIPITVPGFSLSARPNANKPAYRIFSILNPAVAIEVIRGLVKLSLRLNFYDYFFNELRIRLSLDV